MAKICPATGDPVLYTGCLDCEERGHCGLRQEDVPAGRVRYIIAGSRSFSDYSLLRKVMSRIAGQYPKERIEIISGGAQGADRLGEMFAKRNGLKLTRFPADWTKYGTAAGPIRNRQMAEYVGRDGILVAFWDGKSSGTKHMITTAYMFGLSVHVISISEEDYGQELIRQKA